jgi:hypothetical protein
MSGTLASNLRVLRIAGGSQAERILKLLPYLSAATRQAKSPLFLLMENFESVADAHRGTTVKTKLRSGLELVANRTGFPGDWVTLDPSLDAPMLDVASDAEFTYLVDHLAATGRIHRRWVGRPGTQDEQGGFRQQDLQAQLTVGGWEEIAPASGSVAGTCFVAMSFDPILNPAFDEGIIPSVEHDCGFRVVRVDRIHHNDAITDRILSGIRSAQFVVADFTLQRQGVYYEAGFAQGLGRPVVWTCRRDDSANLHFDTRQFNHVLWTDPVDLRRQLTDRIRATIPAARLV